MSIITKKGFNFAFDELKCRECEGGCCTGESGFIWITPKEMLDIANFLEIDIEEFKKNYLIKIGYKYSIKERKITEDNYECIFFDKKISGCSIYPFRPTQCKTYPFWDYFKTNKDELIKECPAIL